MTSSGNLAHELQRIRNMPYGSARVAAAEAVVRKVEDEGALAEQLLPAALLDLVEAYAFTDDGPSTFVAFAKALRVYDSRPELFDEVDEHNLYWEFKWVAGDIVEYPNITRTQVEALLEDMERRYRLAGRGEGPVAMARFRWAWLSGASDIEELRARWLAAEPSKGDDCRACLIGQQVNFLTDVGAWENAVDLAQTQQWECNQEPEQTNHAMALSAYMMGDVELALKAHRKALALAGDEGITGFVSKGRVFELLARSGNFDRALRGLLLSDLRDANHDQPPLVRLRFLLGLLRGVSAHLNVEEGSQEAQELQSYALKECRGLAAQFDERNGNDFYADQVDAALTAAAGPVLDLDTCARAALAGHVLDGVQSNISAASETSIPTASETSISAANETTTNVRAKAELALAERDYLKAAELFNDLATDYEQSGSLGDAGLAYAEAGQCLASIGEDISHELFAKAVPLLRAGNVELNVISTILSAWVHAATRAGELDTLIAASRELLNETEKKEHASHSLFACASLRHTLALALTEQGALDEAAVQALTAGKAFGKHAFFSEAAHAFWLAGKVTVLLGRTEEAIWALESAFEGFTAAGKRKEKVDVASELIDLFKASGLPERAAKVAESL